MDQHPTASRFKTTSWTLIVRAQGSADDLEQLFGMYWSPCYAFLRRQGHSSHDAADLTQGFLTEIVLERDLIKRADPERGKFRSFLISALSKFVIDEYRKAHGRDGKRMRVMVPKDPLLLALAEPNTSEDPAQAFDRQWAATVLDIAMCRLEESCNREGLGQHWIAFEARVKGPAVYGTEPASIDSLLKALDASGPEEISSMLHTVKRKFRSIYRDVVAETIVDPDQLDEEIQQLKELLSTG